jgi:hypothetical protein
MNHYAFSDYESSDDEFEFSDHTVEVKKEEISKDVILNEQESK